MKNVRRKKIYPFIKMTNESILYGLSSYTGLNFSNGLPYTNSIPFFFNHQRRWDLVLILESLYYNTYMMRYIAQALFRGFCSGFVESMQCSNFQ